MLEIRELIENIKIGLDGNSLVFFVLANLDPSIITSEIGVPWQRVKMPSGRRRMYREINIKIRGDIQLKDFYRLYGFIKKYWYLLKRKDFNVLHYELYSMVQQKGGAPTGKGTVAFWKSILDEWTKTHDNNKFHHWKSAKRAYDRIYTKLITRYS